MTALFWAAAAGYAVAGALFLVFLVRGREVKAATAALFVAFLVHMLEIGARGVAGMHPATSAREAMGFLAWLIVGAFLLAQTRRSIHAVGTFVAPAALVLLFAARLAPDDGARGSITWLSRVHVSLAVAGLTSFALATGLAVLYLVEERQLKQKRVGALLKSGSALTTLDTLSFRCVQVGFPMFTVAMVTGAWQTARSAAGIRPEYTIALVAWSAFAGLLIARTTAGWRGRRAALITISGFTAALVVLLAYVARAGA